MWEIKITPLIFQANSRRHTELTKGAKLLWNSISTPECDWHKGSRFRYFRLEVRVNLQLLYNLLAKPHCNLSFPLNLHSAVCIYIYLSLLSQGFQMGNERHAITNGTVCHLYLRGKKIKQVVRKWLNVPVSAVMEKAGTSPTLAFFWTLKIFTRDSTSSIKSASQYIFLKNNLFPERGFQVKILLMNHVQSLLCGIKSLYPKHGPVHSDPGCTESTEALPVLTAPITCLGSEDWTPTLSFTLSPIGLQSR